MKHQDIRSKIKDINILDTLEAVATHGDKQVVSVLKKILSLADFEVQVFIGAAVCSASLITTHNFSSFTCTCLLLTLMAFISQT